MALSSNQCGKTIEDPDAPAQPLWVQKSAPEDSLERGIDADPIGDYIYMEWYPNIEEDLSGYLLYRASGEKDNKYVLIADILAYSTAGNDTTFIDENVELNCYYYYYLLAYDQAGNKSQSSDTISYQLIEKVALNSPLTSIQSTRPDFKWSDFTNLTYQYIIRLEKIQPSEVIWIYRMNRSNYVDYLQSVVFDINNTAKQHELISGTTYRWRIDAISSVDQNDYDNAGSESEWGYFSINK